MHYFKLENIHTHTKKKTQIQEDIMRQKEMKGKMRMKAEWLKFPLLNQFARQTNTDIHVSSDVVRGGGRGGRDWHFSISNWMSLWTTSFQQCFNRSQGYTNLYAIRKFFLVLNRVKQSEQILSWENSEFFSDPCSTPTNQLLSSTPKV